MNDIIFIFFWLGASYVFGLSLTTGSTFSGRHFAAPVIGYAAIATVATVGYVYGAASVQCTILITMAAAAVVASLRKSSDQKRIDSSSVLAVLLVAAIALLAVLPKWTGGAQFYAMQINPYDQFNYLNFSTVIHDYTYQTIKSPPLGWAEGGNMFKFASDNIDLRPAVNIVHATFYWPFYASAVDAYYPYMALFQVLMSFSVAFLVAQFAPGRPLVSLLIGAGFALGPLFQHAVDLNAWSQVAGMPLAFMVIGLGYRVVALKEHSRSALVALAVTAAGLMFIYPEITTIVAVAGLVLGLGHIIWTRDYKSVLVALGACLAATAVASLYWRGSIGFLLNQLSFASQLPRIDWAAYYDSQLFGSDVDWWPYINRADLYPLINYQKASAIIDPLMGQLGLYYLMPSALTHIHMRVVWKAVAIFYVVILLILGFMATRRNNGKILLAALLAGLVVPGYALANGYFWTAGKALGMTAPILFILVTLPLAIRFRPYWKVPAALFLAFHIGVGLWRPVAAHDPSGVPFPKPYPHFPTKAEIDWDIVGRIHAAAACNGIDLDISDPLLDSYVQVSLSGSRISWSTLQPIRPVYGPTTPQIIQPRRPADCLISDGPPREGYATVIDLKRRP